MSDNDGQVVYVVTGLKRLNGGNGNIVLLGAKRV
jgi:hypothetical protein